MIVTVPDDGRGPPCLRNADMAMMVYADMAKPMKRVCSVLYVIQMMSLTPIVCVTSA
jgi:hypothetical protein